MSIDFHRITPEQRGKLRTKLVKLFALIGSANEHESKAARGKYDELLNKHRMTWNDALELLQQPGPASNNSDDEPTFGETPAEVKDVAVLDLIYWMLQDFVYLDSDDQYVAVALWVLHCYVHDRFTCTPRLCLTSPVNGCGKTVLLEFIQNLLPHVRNAVTIYRPPPSITHSTGTPVVRF